MDKKLLQSRVETTIKDPLEIYKHMHGRIMHIFETNSVRLLIEEYRCLRKSKMKQNRVIIYSNEALANYILVLLRKLIAKKELWSLHNVINKYIQSSPELKIWFNKKIKELNPQFEVLLTWSNNVSLHFTKIAQGAPQEFENKYGKNLRNSEVKIMMFLLEFLSQIKYEIEKTANPKEVLINLHKETQEFGCRVKDDMEQMLPS